MGSTPARHRRPAVRERRDIEGRDLMRELPIITSDGSVDDCTVAIVQACMQFPDDLHSIEEDISAHRIRAGTGFRDTRLGRHLNSNWRDARLGGMYAGS